MQFSYVHYDDYFLVLKDTIGTDMKIRAPIFHLVSVIETLVGLIIQQHYSKIKKDIPIAERDMSKPNLKYYKKHELLFEILEDNYQSFYTQYSNLDQDIRNIKKFRNHMAHKINIFIRHLTAEEYENNLYLVNTPNDKKAMIVTNKQSQAIADKALDVITMLNSILYYIIHGEQDPLLDSFPVESIKYFY